MCCAVITTHAKLSDVRTYPDAPETSGADVQIRTTIQVHRYWATLIMAATFVHSAIGNFDLWSSSAPGCRRHASLLTLHPCPWKHAWPCARGQHTPALRGPRDSAPARSQRRLCRAMASTLDVASIREQHGAVGKYLQSLGAYTLLAFRWPVNRAHHHVPGLHLTSREAMMTWPCILLAGWGQGWVDLLQERVRKGELHATVDSCRAAVSQSILAIADLRR